MLTRNLWLKETLVYYDGPQVIIAEDLFAAKYLCVLVEIGEKSDRFLCVQISPRRLGDFMAQEIDLRTALQGSESGEALAATTSETDYGSLQATSLKLEDIQESWLPEPGFFMPGILVEDAEVVRESLHRNRAIFNLRLDPPEARGESKIAADTLSEALALVQRLVKHAYRKALRTLDEHNRQPISGEEYYGLDVFASSPGSFTLHMQSEAVADLIGHVPISRAFGIIDQVTDVIDDPEEATERVAQIGGHFATAYRDLVRFISETKTPIAYEWAMPERHISISHTITINQAAPLYERLISRKDIGKETLVLVGSLSKVDEKYGTWRIRSFDDDREYSGYTVSQTRSELAGLVIETQTYEFECEERLEEERGTGREIATLYLISLREMGNRRSSSGKVGI